MKPQKNLLSRALRLSDIPPQHVAFVGAGGKTTAMFKVARELAPCIVTTTTHLGAWQADLADQHIIISKAEDVNQLEEISFSGVILVTGEKKKNRFTSLSDKNLAWLEKFANYHSLSLFIEADGARQKAIKSPKENEPVIPDFIDTVVVVTGLSAIGKPLNDDVVYNAVGFAKLGKMKEGEKVSPDNLIQVLTHEKGGLKNIPEKARKIALLTQANTPELQAISGKIAKKALSKFNAAISLTFEPSSVISQKGMALPHKFTEKFRTATHPKADAVPSDHHDFEQLSSNLQIFETSSAIILAAGKSSRFGESKQLLDYQGKTFIRAVAEKALKAELSPVVVVTGAEHDEITFALENLDVKIVHNPSWKEGQSSSICAGVNALPSKSGSVLFLLADQPQVTPSVMRTLVEEHRRTLNPVIAPMVEGRRANPVLFDRVTFLALLKLKGDIGGRGIFSQFSPSYILWLDSALLLDVDSPEDYKKLLNISAENGG